MRRRQDFLHTNRVHLRERVADRLELADETREESPNSRSEWFKARGERRLGLAYGYRPHRCGSVAASDTTVQSKLKEN
jgi:hypothetical protein